MRLLYPHKVLIKIMMKKMMNQIIKTKRRAMIKGEMRMSVPWRPGTPVYKFQVKIKGETCKSHAPACD
jgi:hypothetical protein